MKGLAIFFFIGLMITDCTIAGELDSTLTSARYLGTAQNSALRTWAPTCPHGQYRLNDECIDISVQPSGCKSITVNGTTYSTYLLGLNFDTFHYREYSDRYPCYGMYELYTIGDGTDTSDFDKVLISVRSTGSYYVIGSSGAPTCPHGQYHLKGKCIAYGSEDAVDGCDGTVGNADSDYITVANQGSFMAKRTELPYCRGDYTEYAYTLQTDDGIYPVYSGTYLEANAGAPIGVFAAMTQNNPCKFNPDDYYSISLLSDKTSDSFMHPDLGMCTRGKELIEKYKKFAVKTDCKDITNDTQIAQNEFCGVLCENSGEVYTNSGVCSTNGYCMNGDKKMRLHVARPDGEKYSYPLYASKTSTPALHFKFLDKVTNAEKMCYVNLVPPAAIDHFVDVKPNPIRVGKSFSWTELGTGKTQTTTNLITID